MWLCCRCYRHFWGSKQETPAVDIYGKPTHVVNPGGACAQRSKSR
jgi:hypothetical protein